MGPGAGAIFSSGKLGSAPEKMGTWAHRAESTPGGCEECGGRGRDLGAFCWASKR